MKTRIYQIKKVDLIILKWYQNNFPNCTYRFYWYKKGDDKIIGCAVSNNKGKLIHLATQATLEEYKTMEG